MNKQLLLKLGLLIIYIPLIIWVYNANRQFQLQLDKHNEGIVYVEFKPGEDFTYTFLSRYPHYIVFGTDDISSDYIPYTGNQNDVTIFELRDEVDSVIRVTVVKNNSDEDTNLIEVSSPYDSQLTKDYSEVYGIDLEDYVRSIYQNSEGLWTIDSLRYDENETVTFNVTISGFDEDYFLAIADRNQPYPYPDNLSIHRSMSFVFLILFTLVYIFLPPMNLFKRREESF